MTRRDRFVSEILHGGDTRFFAALLRLALIPPAILHQFGLEIYLWLYRIGILRRERLPVPIIAIGNLTSGGTGKTPTAVLLASYLRQSGRRVVVLSRGHGRRGERHAAPQIVSDGKDTLLTADEAGDEPLLLASLLPGVPVIVGKDRRQSGRLALRKFAPDVIVLDDALQFWQLHRDLDIVLVDARRPFDNGYLLPRGLLREPVSHLNRAGIVLLTHCDLAAPEPLADAVAQAKWYASSAPCLRTHHAPTGWLRASDNTLLPPDALAGQRVVLFSGIANSDGFANLARGLGAIMVSRHDFGDHHPYTDADLAMLASLSTTMEIDAFVTTDKDLVKIVPRWESKVPLYALRIGIEMEDSAVFWETVEGVFRISG